MPHVAPRTPQEARTGGSHERRTRDGVDAFVKAFAALLKVGSLTRTDSSVSASVDTLADVRGGILPEVWAALAELRERCYRAWASVSSTGGGPAAHVRPQTRLLESTGL